MTNTSHAFGMTIREEFGDVLFLLSFRWSVSDERSFAYAQDDKGKKFGMTFFLFCCSNDIFLVFTVPMTFCFCHSEDISLVFVIPRNDSDEESYPNKQ